MGWMLSELSHQRLRLPPFEAFNPRRGMGPADLAGRRILVVEDQFLVALQLEQLVRAAGGTVVGPVPSLERALSVVWTEELDGALLDVNLHGRRVTPVARALRVRGIPFILVTAHGRATLAEPVLRAAPRVNKAAVVRDLGRAMADLFGASPRPEPPG